MIKCTIALCCLLCCVKSGDNYKFVKPTPVLDVLMKKQSTDALTPLKFNKDPVAETFTTGINININSTPVLGDIQTTFLVEPVLNSIAPVLNQFSTTAAKAVNEGPVANPTPVINGPMIFETGPAKPILINSPITPLLSTGVVVKDEIKPTPVVITIGTQPVAVALTNDDEQEPALIGSVDPNLIEPSQVFDVGSYTSNYERGPNQVSSTESISNPVTQSVNYCTCINYENKNTPASTKPITSDAENALAYQPLNPGLSKPDWHYPAARPPQTIFQHIINVQLNVYLNNFPFLTANAVPLYF